MVMIHHRLCIFFCQEIKILCFLLLLGEVCVYFVMSDIGFELSCAWRGKFRNGEKIGSQLGKICCSGDGVWLAHFIGGNSILGLDTPIELVQRDIHDKRIRRIVFAR